VPVDDSVSRHILEVVRPVAVEAAVMAVWKSLNGKTMRLPLCAGIWKQHATQPAERSGNMMLRILKTVRSRELERRWNEALQHVRQLEMRIDELDPVKPGPVTSAGSFVDLAEHIDAIWSDPHTDSVLKTRIVRTLIDEVVADVDSSAAEIILVIHWKGGIHTEVRVPRRRRGYNNGHTDKSVVEAVAILVRMFGRTHRRRTQPQWIQNRAWEPMDEGACDRFSKPSPNSDL
jgi:hypothetical protein